MSYEGLVYVSGSTKASATIEDLTAVDWHGVIGEIRGLSPPSGLHTIRIGEGASAGAFALVEIDYDEERRSGTLAGRTPFGPEPGSTADCARFAACEDLYRNR